MGDKPLKQDASKDDDPRKDRARDEREATEDRELTEEERLEMFQASFHQAALPDVPKLPGWHFCWLTTTNPRDPLQQRMRYGYVPVKPEDVPGYEYAAMKTGEYAGMIGVNEMLLFKLPDSMYQKYMTLVHHDLPREEEKKLTQAADLIREQAQAAGADVVEGDGLQEMRKEPRRPVFAG